MLFGMPFRLSRRGSHSREGEEAGAETWNRRRGKQETRERLQERKRRRSHVNKHLRVEGPLGSQKDVWLGCSAQLRTDFKAARVTEDVRDRVSVGVDKDSTGIQ